MTVDVFHADVLDWAADYDGEPFHALLCDPPYHLTSGNVSVDWDAFQTEKGTTNKSGRGHNTSSAGFMGKKWDGGDIAYRPETWAALAEHLYPGAFGMAFASSRGWHRLAVAIEDAGLIIHPSIFGWAYGSGFPKATRIDTQVDADAGAEREVMGKHPSPGSTNGRLAMGNGWQEAPDITAPATDLAKTWEGHRYGLQALKPALEPIIVFQKPYAGRPVDDITATGAGALNIDGARVPTSDVVRRANNVTIGGNGVYQGGKPATTGAKPGEGRWPANLILLDGGAADALDRQSGIRQAGAFPKKANRTPNVAMRGNNYPRERSERLETDSGGASRFFYQVRRQLDAADPVCYTAKASRAEREAGLAGFRRTTVDDGRNKPIDNPYLRGETERVNTHPTVKPLDLTRYLATLLLPPDAYAPRRLLVPFAGAGSEMIGAWQAGWEVVTGIEMMAEYVDIARARIAEWQRRGVQLELFG